MEHKSSLSLSDQLTARIEKRVELQVCATCLKAAACDKKDIAGGISIANKEKFFNFTQGWIFSIDYQ